MPTDKRTVASIMADILGALAILDGQTRNAIRKAVRLHDTRAAEPLQRLKAKRLVTLVRHPGAEGTFHLTDAGRAKIEELKAMRPGERNRALYTPRRLPRLEARGKRYKIAPWPRLLPKGRPGGEHS